MTVTLAVTVTVTVKIFAAKLTETIANIYKDLGKIWNGPSCPPFSHQRTHYLGVPKIVDNQKPTFLTHFFNFGHEGVPNVTKITYNMIIWWENSPRKKIGAVSFTGGWAILFKKKNMDRSIDLAVQHICIARILRDSVTSIAPLPIPDTNIEHWTTYLGKIE